MLPSFASLSITAIYKRKCREEDAPTLPPPPVQPEAIIQTFLQEYSTAYENVKTSNLAQSDYETFITHDAKTQHLNAEILEVTNLKSEAEQLSQDILKRSEYYRSEEGKAARRQDTSLKLSDEQKEEERRLYYKAVEDMATHEKRIATLQEARLVRLNRIYWLFTYIDLMTTPYNPSDLKTMDLAFTYATQLWNESTGGRFNFDLTVAPWDNQGFKVRGLRWLQDLYFQRKLISLLPNFKITTSMHGCAIIFGNGIEALEMAFGIAIAVMRVQETYNGRPISNKPELSSTHNLLGWDIDLGLDDMPLSLKESFQYFQNVDSANRSFMHKLIDRVINNDGYTRKLAILINTGDTGARAQVAKHSCIEFGLGGQTCVAITGTLKHLHQSSSMLHLLYPMEIDVSRKSRESIQAFQRGSSKVGLITWGGHARVIFKVDDGCAIVDPWKPAEKVRPPVEIRNAFGNDPVWIDRESEQCAESSCAFIAMVRAVILTIVAHNGGNADALYAAAKSDMVDTSVHGPIAVMLVRCAHLSVVPSPYSLEEVF